MKVEPLKIEGMKYLNSTDVSDIYEYTEDFNLVVFFDYVSVGGIKFPNVINGKAEANAAISRHVLEELEKSIPTYLTNISIKNKVSEEIYHKIVNRAYIVKKSTPMQVKVIMRQYMTEEAWEEHNQYGDIGGWKPKNHTHAAENLRRNAKLGIYPLFSAYDLREESRLSNLPLIKLMDTMGIHNALKLDYCSLQVINVMRDIYVKIGITVAQADIQFGTLDNTVLGVIGTPGIPNSTVLWDFCNYGSPDDIYKSEAGEDEINKWILQETWDGESTLDIPVELVDEAGRRYMDLVEKFEKN